MVQRLLDRLALWIVQRAMRRPSAHLVHEDGTPHLDRYWLLRLGGTKDSEPWFGIRVHHVRSSDTVHFHDSLWHFFSLVLWGEYWDELPLAHLTAPVLNAELEYDRSRGGFVASTLRRRGSWVFRRAPTWHRIRLSFSSWEPTPPPIAGTWLLVITGRQVQDTWGHLVDGLKVPHRVYRKRIFRDRAKEPAHL